MNSVVNSERQESELRKELTVLDATSIVVGTIIGSAIFLIPSTVATLVGSPSLVLVVWVVGGILTVFGALSLAELGSMYPGAGGLYVYLRETYGPLAAFLYGWGLLAMIHSGGIAGLALGFGVYFGEIFGLATAGQKAVAVSCVVLLTIVNSLGIRVGKFTQNIVTVAKVGCLLGMIGLLMGHGARTGPLGKALHAPLFVGSWYSVGAGLIAVLWAYEGWHVVSFTAGEMRRPTIDLPRSLIIGTGIIGSVYLLANVSYYMVLTPDEIRSNPAVATAALTKSVGAEASYLIASLILVSVLGSMNAMVLTGPRVYYAMAKDGAFFKAFGVTSKRFSTPNLGLWVQGLWTCALCCSGTYQQLLMDVIFTAWIFYGLAVAGVIVLRRCKPALQRRFRVPGFPFVPVIFCAAALGVAVSAIAESPKRALLGAGILLTGIPLFMRFRRVAARNVERTEPESAPLRLQS